MWINCFILRQQTVSLDDFNQCSWETIVCIGSLFYILEVVLNVCLAQSLSLMIISCLKMFMTLFQCSQIGKWVGIKRVWFEVSLKWLLLLGFKKHNDWQPQYVSYYSKCWYCRSDLFLKFDWSLKKIKNRRNRWARLYLKTGTFFNWKHCLGCGLLNAEGEDIERC